MVASGVVVVMEMELLPLFWMVGVATWVIANSATAEDSQVACVAIALTVVVLVTEKGTLYSVLEAVGVPPSVV